jgi:bacteriocin-like protein
MEEAMRKTKMQKPKPADALLKTSRKKDIELTEKELDKVTGGAVDMFLKIGDIKGESLDDRKGR